MLVQPDTVQHCELGMDDFPRLSSAAAVPQSAGRQPVPWHQRAIRAVEDEAAATSTKRQLRQSRDDSGHTRSLQSVPPLNTNTTGSTPQRRHKQPFTLMADVRGQDSLDYDDDQNAADEDAVVKAGGPADASDDDSSQGEKEPAPLTGGYDPEEFRQLPVSSEVRELFGLITDYQPQTVHIEPVLKPFILEYIPAVGDVDAFIKIPRPDDVEDNLGLTVLDEPCAKQSDPTVLNLQLRAVTKTEQPAEPIVKRLDRGDRSAKEIEQWISSIGELHQSKPHTTVKFSKPMPDIDTLMQEWPPELEELLKNNALPTADLTDSLEEYVDVVCALLDIPVHASRIQSLYHLFSLYIEFKNSQHFKQLADDNELGNTSARHSSSALQHNTHSTDRLEL